MLRNVLTAALTTALVCSAAPLAAQVEPRLGLGVSFADDFDLGIGVRTEFNLKKWLEDDSFASRLIATGSFDYFFPDCEDCRYFEVNANLLHPFQLTASRLEPYAGAGLNVARFSVPDIVLDDGLAGGGSDTEVGLNILGGFYFPFGKLNAFAEGRLELNGGEQFVLSFGVLFGPK